MDRQDIDALLIGALYGELTHADEARLAAHLDSHPTDRGALDDLKSARAAVRESRIFELQLDPPQAVSALLLQEAHRRAPKRAVVAEEKESWFFRFTKMFLAHPAMAAAAMLVLVVGVASMLYVKKGDPFVDKEAAPQAVEKLDQTVMAPSPANEAPPADPNQGLAEGAAGSGYAVGLADKDMAETKADESVRDRKLELAKQQQGAREEQKNKKTASAIVVDTQKPQPKELPEPRAKAAKKGAAASDDFALDRGFDSTGVVGGTGTTTLQPNAATGAGGGAASGRVATTPGSAGPARNTPPAPPPPVTAAPAPSGVAQSTSKPSAPAKVTKEAEAKPEAAPAKDSALIAWAKGQHASVVALAGKGDCSGAAKLALTIINRAPDYYTQFMATDRRLKNCQSYIANERAADAERSEKTRAQKRVNADEPAPAPTQSH